MAFSFYDFADSGFATTIVTVLFARYYAGVVAGGPEGIGLLGARVPGAALYAWLVSVSMGIVAVTAPFLGALADRRGSRVRWLAGFWLPGILLTLGLRFVGPGDWLEGGLAFALAYACFAGASVFYNALLPEVAPRERLGRASGISWGVGYLGGALLLTLNLIMLKRPQLLGAAGGSFTVHDCFASAGIWWFLFALPLFWVFRYEARRSRKRTGRGVLSDFSSAVAQVKRTARELVGLRHLRRFFLSYLLYNDGVQTVVTMASIFGAQELGMPDDQLILFFLLIQMTAFAGSIVLGWLADRWGHKEVLLLCVAAWTLFTLWAWKIGLLGNAVREYWVLGASAGLFLGGIQSCSRSLLAAWIPSHRESEMFGFFAVMSRVASILGPLLYGALVLVCGSLRWAILSVTLFFAVGGGLLLRLRVDAIRTERAVLASKGVAGAIGDN